MSEAVHGAGASARAAGRPPATASSDGPERLAEHERHQRPQRAREQAAEAVELGAPQSDLPGDVRDEPLEHGRIGHERLPVSGYRRNTSFCAPLIVSAASMS